MSQAWPTPGDYHGVVQSPRLAFQDAELAAAEVVCTPLGLPRVASGNFASVYQLRAPADHSRRWAVRCFLRQVGDSQARYAAVDQHLRRQRPASLVDFAYLEQGIRVRGTWYPAVKMAWIDGQPLNAWVEANLGDARRLRGLAVNWAALLSSLAAAGIAHGDLQHGNVLVAGDELRLVDYDGMFVPALAGMPANETGHPAYQHPNRGARDFHARIDRFAALVIYVGLLALAAEPGLWTAHDNGDNMLFRADDFRRPGQTALWRDLAAAAAPDLAEPLAALLEACRDPNRAPSLDTFRRPGNGKGAANGGASRPAPTPAPGEPWWREYVPVPAADPPNGKGNGHGHEGRPWWSALAGDRRGSVVASIGAALLGTNHANANGGGAAAAVVAAPAPPRPRRQGRLPGWVKLLRGVGQIFDAEWLPASKPRRGRQRNAKPPSVARQSPTTGPVIVSRTGRKFHRPECGLVARITPEKVAGYASRADALNADFKPCALCQP